jgi:hypothetical protein
LATGFNAIWEHEQMAQFVYIDETGADGSGGRDPHLTLVAVIVDEDQVQPLSQSLTELTWSSLGWIPKGFEFHGVEIWQGMNHWNGRTHAERIAAYEAAIGLLAKHGVGVAHSTINKPGLHDRY